MVETVGKRGASEASQWRYMGSALSGGGDGEHGCLHPIEMLNEATGELVQIRCGSRSEKKCSGCSWLYKKDTAKILRSGLMCDGGAFRYFFLTLTAPSFGKTHLVPKRGERRKCGCGAWHDAEKDIDIRGVPLDCDKYDYEAQALFNYRIGKLWNATLSLLRKDLDGLAYAKVYEWQQRGALHAHVLLRVPASSCTGLVADVAGYIGARAASVTALGGDMRWGERRDCKEIKGGADADSVIGYLKKAVAYVTKDVCEERPSGVSRNKRHIAMLEQSARVMCCDRCIDIQTDAKARIARMHQDEQDGFICYLRWLSLGAGSCGALPHRRWGARSGVMSISRGAKERKGWSAKGITRKYLAGLRKQWFWESSRAVREIAAALEECGGVCVEVAPS